MSVYNLNKYGYSCPLCGDGISYPEKFISNFLLYLNISFITQLNKMDFKWIGKYRYDFYLPKYNIIIETHGMQHYEENKKFRISLNEQKKIDKIKEDLALSNNIEHYIILDCRESTLNWIKKSIMGSKLSDILNISFDNISWNEIDLKSMQSNVIKACELWNNNKYLTTKNISKILHCSHNTIISYLKKGTNAGICNYSIEEANERAYLYSKKYISKPIFFNGFIYDSATEFSKIIKKNKSTVGNWLLGVPPKGDNEIYSSVHYATEEEMKKYPRYKIND